MILRWSWLQNGSHGALTIEWREIGGALGPAPSKSGYGMSIIRELIPYQLGGTAHIAFASDGLRCRLEVPAEWISRRISSNGGSGLDFCNDPDTLTRDNPRRQCVGGLRPGAPAPARKESSGLNCPGFLGGWLV